LGFTSIKFNIPSADRTNNSVKINFFFPMKLEFIEEEEEDAEEEAE
jgi:hypothetical protein